MLIAAESPVNLDPAIIAAGLVGLPQTECPVVHHFSDGVCIREMAIPAGTFIIGHAHKKGGINFLLKGSGVLFVDGKSMQVTAPQMIYSGAGSKMMHALTDVVWMNVFPNPENSHDIEALESVWAEKSPSFLALQKEMLSIESDARIVDVANYSGVSDELVSCLNKMPVAQCDHVAEFRQSPIDGCGAFAPMPFLKDECIGKYIVGKSKTELASKINHAKTPNCYLSMVGDAVYLVAMKNIHGRLGGSHGEELTIDYRTLENFIEVSK